MVSIALKGAGALSPAPLFSNLTLSITADDRLGLVAPNGAGKSTLLRCLAGQAELQAGTITRARGLRVALVEQEVPPHLPGLSLAEALRRAIPAERRAAEAWRAEAMLDELDTPPALRGTALGALSGGWQRLALLARAALAGPDLLLLDEPTNHLDEDRIAWLENWLWGLGVPMVIASHDRAFLDACTNRTLFLRPGASALFDHPFSRARELLAADDAAQADRFERDSREAARLRRSAAELRNIGINSRSDAAQHKSAQIRRRAEALEATLREAPKARAARLQLAAGTTHARILLDIENTTVTAPDGRPLLRIPRLVLRQGERLVLRGPNGSGKSSLLALVRRALTQAVPGIRPSATLLPFHLDQHAAATAETPFAAISRFGQADQRTLSLLAGAGIPPDRQHRPVAQLSPGQRARLAMLAFRLTEPNFVLLDEPTNHLDIPGREALEAELLAHDVSGIIVTHDRRFAEIAGSRHARIVKAELVM
ncbi:ABC-F family ATP-binding cassette domain-containing protein [Rhodovarius crocodyli]|uniref:ABC-F family ATP-binding cassette domain-containing protein n=1 Tax=Rhodovarius crocodyli TaxID=1979269 RepID=A0A437MIT2_9PROT|nr:ATP-binding cassette domain-containing protein [Rhodovarius crocodyli]RVT97568.1 ABC-F family ATP-binding cassette domain-containing protein [Rhodovarius crocodyli]